MKIKFIYIITFLIIILSIKNVQAKTPEFYEGEYIDNIYLKRISDNYMYYQKAQIFREKGTNNPVYCIEPFTLFNKEAKYEISNDFKYLTNEQKEKISLLSYYGYTYKNHTEKKWYAITQLLIWKTIYPNQKFYFTESLNGNEIKIFENEINELKKLVNEHYILPTFANTNKDIVYKNTSSITDTNKKIKEYEFENKYSNNININENTIILKDFEIGEHKIEFKKKNNFYNRNIIFCKSPNSQDIITIGNIKDTKFFLNLNVDKTKLIIKKIDKDNKKFESQGDANLKNAKIELYNSYNIKLNTLTINNEEEIIENLFYGKYYIVETKAGLGYKINTEKYYFTISKDKKEVTLNIENEVIKKDFIIQKLYGNESKFVPENNISFNIYNSKNKLVKTVITNKNGLINLKLPFGKYIIKQLTTTEGYNKIRPLELVVENEIPEKIILKNYKIKIPDTYVDKNNQKHHFFNLIKYICQKIKLINYKL